MNTPNSAASNMILSGLNLIKQAFTVYDKDLKLVIANLQFQRMFNLPDALIQPGASFEEALSYVAQQGDYGELEDTAQFVAERIEKARAFEPHYLERTRSNGSTISIEGSPLQDGGWVTVYTDITDIKSQDALLRSRSANLSDTLFERSEELAKINRELTHTVAALEEAKRELTASQDKLNLTNAMIPAHIARVDRDGVYTYSNRKLDTVLANRSNDIVGRHFREALGDEIFAEIEGGFAKALQGDNSVLEFEDKSSGQHLRVALTPDRNAAGDINGAYILSMDVTDDVNARNALTHTRRRELAAQLTSGLAHDFSNLLTIILGQQNQLEKIEELPPEIEKISQTIKAAAKRGGDLLTGLSRIDAERVLAVRPVEVAEFMNNFAQLAHAAIPENITLVLDNRLPDPQILLDPGFAQDALLNLVLNASEAMNGAGKIVMTLAKANPDFMEITVVDTGPGFTDEALKHALAPFYTSKTRKIGHGLGLSTAFDFAKLSGGKIRLRNQPQGGAIVTIRLPYQQTQPVASGLVLLVDDTLEIRTTVRGYLREMGHAVVEAATAQEAEILANMPEVTHVITDLDLGEGPDGYDFANKLRSHNKSIPILVITGLAASDQLHKRVSEDFVVLQKPFTFSTLAAQMQRMSAL
jgi:signal transduction histidine kinase/CheY-like chemotaxis protein